MEGSVELEKRKISCSMCSKWRWVEVDRVAKPGRYVVYWGRGRCRCKHRRGEP